MTTTLDTRELRFLLRDEYIQVAELVIRKTPALDQAELALARGHRTKLTPGEQTEPEQTAPSKRRI